MFKPFDQNEISSRETRIRFLVRQKFPALFAGSSVPPAQFAVLRKQADQYRKALDAKQDSEIDSQYGLGKAEAARAKLERDEAARRFNQPFARSDVTRWAKMPFWTLDETVALSLGRDPKFASWESVKNLVDVSPFAAEFASQREIVMRAITMRQLREKAPPVRVIAWAEDIQFHMPEDLIETVKALSPPDVDWRKLFEQSQAKVQAQTAQIEELARDKSRPENGRIGTRERESLLKLVIGMAVGAYEFHPRDGRRGIAKIIAHDLASAGLPMDEDTVRKYLAEGKERLPREKTE